MLLPFCEIWGDSIMLQGCFAVEGIGHFIKIDVITRKEQYVEILKQHLKASARKYQVWHILVFQMKYYPQPKWLYSDFRTKKLVFWGGHHKILTSVLWRSCGNICKGVCSKAAYKMDSVPPVLSGGIGKNFNKLL